MKENEKKEFNEKVEVGLSYYDLCFIIKGLNLFRYSYALINTSYCFDHYIECLINDLEKIFKEAYKHD